MKNTLAALILMLMILPSISANAVQQLSVQSEVVPAMLQEPQSAPQQEEKIDPETMNVLDKIIRTRNLIRRYELGIMVLEFWRPQSQANQALTMNGEAELIINDIETHPKTLEHSQWALKELEKIEHNIGELYRHNPDSDSSEKK